MEREDTMRLALALAREAAEHGEVPVGCVIVGPDGTVIGRGRNRREEEHDATAHAEVEAIREACAARGDWRLDDCALYVTLEPCPMCSGAIIQARIDEVYFGASDPKSGAVRSVQQMFDLPYNYHPAVTEGLLREECSAMLTAFFRELRLQRRKKEDPEEKK